MYFFTLEIVGEVPDSDVWDLPEEKENQSVEEHKSVILHLLSQLKLGMDLTKVYRSFHYVSLAGADC